MLSGKTISASALGDPIWSVYVIYNLLKETGDVAQ
jgi:hypothetical protein